MTIVWYLLAAMLGAIGALSLVRLGERLAFGGGTGSIGVQVLIGLIGVFGAWKCVQKARKK